MKNAIKITITMIALTVISAGCVSYISKEMRAQVQEDITVEHALANPKSSLDKVVMWGGIIVEAENLKKGTLLEIVQKPTRPESRPRDVDESEGRFLVLYEDFLDAAIYSSGREVTVAGRLTEFRKGNIGQMEYTFPVVSAQEIYLWPKKTEKKYYYRPYPYGPYWYHPHYPRGPWYW